MTRGACIARLASMIAAVERPHPARVALDGVDGAGKTHLADELVGPLSRSGRQIIRASIDGFHYPRAHRYKRGRESADGYFHDSFNYGRAPGTSLSGSRHRSRRRSNGPCGGTRPAAVTKPQRARPMR